MTKQTAKALLALYGISAANHQTTSREAAMDYWGKSGDEYDAIYTLAVS